MSQVKSRDPVFEPAKGDELVEFTPTRTIRRVVSEVSHPYIFLDVYYDREESPRSSRKLFMDSFVRLATKADQVIPHENH